MSKETELEDITLGQFLRDKIIATGKAKQIIAKETDIRPETISRLIKEDNEIIDHEKLPLFVTALNLNRAEEIKLYQLAKAVPPAVRKAFIEDTGKASSILRIAEKVK